MKYYSNDHLINYREWQQKKVLHIVIGPVNWFNDFFVIIFNNSPLTLLINKNNILVFIQTFR